MKTEQPVKVTIQAVIIRACTVCGGPRKIGDPCASCGNPNPPVIQNAGIQSAYYRSLWKNLVWRTTGQVRSWIRARKINKGVYG